MVAITVEAYKNAKVHTITVKKSFFGDENDECTKGLDIKNIHD